MKSLYCVESISIVDFWIKFKPIIDEYRKTAWGKDGYENWEYIAIEVAKYKDQKDPLWKSSVSDIWNLEDFNRTFNSRKS